MCPFYSSFLFESAFLEGLPVSFGQTGYTGYAINGTGAAHTKGTVPGSPGSDATPGNDAASGVGAASANVKASWGGTHILSDPDTGTK